MSQPSGSASLWSWTGIIRRRKGGKVAGIRARGVGTGSVVLLALTLLGGISIPTAGATFPGGNGKIGFSTNRDGNREVYAMNADGSAPVNLTNNIAFDSGPAWSPDGTRIAFRTNRVGNFEIYVMNADGSAQVNLTEDSAADTEPAWSPDGTKITFTSQRDGNREVYVMNADGSGQVNLTNDAADDGEPAWSPDGTKIAFSTDRDGNYEVYSMNPNGSVPVNLTNNALDDAEPAWSPDGTKIAFRRAQPAGEVYVMNADGSGQANLTNNSATDFQPAWSPDGTKIAFTTDRDGNNEVYVMNADGSGQVNLTNNAAMDDEPDWQALPPIRKTVTLKAKPKKVEAGGKTRLRATVSPCEGHEGDVAEFYRRKKKIATKATNSMCVAKLRVKVKTTTRFRAVSPKQDLDHLAGTSRKVKVKVIPD
jgi:dipeptidyl aminopeptidase/acylaminoacyl peptidase